MCLTPFTYRYEFPPNEVLEFLLPTDGPVTKVLTIFVIFTFGKTTCTQVVDLYEMKKYLCQSLL